VTNRERWTLIAAVLGSSIVFVDSSVVNVALPRIGRELPTTIFGVLEGQSYVYNGYLLTLSALLHPRGALSDFYGRRRLFLIGLVGFGVTSVLCGLAPNMEFLVLSRLLQGAAGAVSSSSQQNKNKTTKQTDNKPKHNTNTKHTTKQQKKTKNTTTPNHQKTYKEKQQQKKHKQNKK